MSANPVPLPSTATLDAKALREALTIAAQIGRARPAVPILGHCRLDFAGNLLRIQASDLEAHATLELHADCGGPVLSTCAPTRQILDALPKRGTVQLLALGDKLSLSHADGSATFHCLPSEDFPSLPKREPLVGTVDLATLRAAFAAVRPAVTPLPSRFSISACLLSDGLAVATDGHRLHVAPVACPKTDSLLIPVTAMEVIAKVKATGLANLHDAPTHMDRQGPRSGGQASISWPGGHIGWRVPEGRFPNWNGVLPNDKAACVVSAPRAAWLAALAAIGKPPGKASSQTILTCSPTAAGLAIRARWNGSERSADLGATVNGMTAPIGLSALYLRDALDSIKADHVALMLRGPNVQAVLSASNGVGTGLTWPDGLPAGTFAVIMPMRLA